MICYELATTCQTDDVLQFFFFNYMTSTKGLGLLCAVGRNYPFTTLRTNIHFRNVAVVSAQKDGEKDSKSNFPSSSHTEQPTSPQTCIINLNDEYWRWQWMRHTCVAEKTSAVAAGLPRLLLLPGSDSRRSAHEQCGWLWCTHSLSLSPSRDIRRVKLPTGSMLIWAILGRRWARRRLRIILTPSTRDKLSLIKTWQEGQAD